MQIHPRKKIKGIYTRKPQYCLQSYIQIISQVSGKSNTDFNIGYESEVVSI